MDLQPVAQLLSWVPSDWLVIGCVAIILIGFTMLRGTTLATALSLSLPVASVLFASIPSAIFLGSVAKQFQSGLPDALVFICLEVVLLFLFMRIVMVFAESSMPIAGFVAGISTTIIVLCVWLQVPSLSDLWHFSPQTASIFGPAYAFWWFLTAYIGLAFARS